MSVGAVSVCAYLGMCIVDINVCLCVCVCVCVCACVCVCVCVCDIFFKIKLNVMKPKGF